MRVSMKPGATVTTSILCSRARIRNEDVKVLMKALVDEYAIILAGLNNPATDPTTHCVQLSERGPRRKNETHDSAIPPGFHTFIGRHNHAHCTHNVDINHFHGSVLPVPPR